MIKIKYQYMFPKTCIQLGIDRQIIHRQDSWNVDSVLSEIALPLIQQLKNNTHSYPGRASYDINFNEVFATIAHYWNGADKQEWDMILDKIIMAFQYYQDCDDIIEMYFNSYDANTALHIVKQLEFDAMCGMMLFIRYYRHLWD